MEFRFFRGRSEDIQQYARNMVGEREDCSPGCGVCCIIPRISNDDGSEFKPAHTKCQYLSEDDRCTIFNSPQRPLQCREFTCRTCLAGLRRQLQQEIEKR